MSLDELDERIALALAPLRQELLDTRRELQALKDRVASLAGRPETEFDCAPNQQSDFSVVEQPRAASNSIWERLRQLPARAEFRSRYLQSVELIQQEVIPSREAAFATVELVELVEEEKRQSDLDLPFFGLWDELEAGLLDSVELEPLLPQPGESYRSQEQVVVRTSRGGQRDTIERCLRCGFRYQGQLLRKAEVSIFV